MKKRGRRILSVILTAVMVFALLPIFGKPMVVKAETTPTSNHAHGAYADKTCSEHAEWSEISSRADLETLCKDGGNGYLKDSIYVTETINVSSGKEVSICLNGYSITQNADKDVFYVEGTLNLFDEVNKSGIITHEPKYKGTGVNVENGIFNMYGGKISGNASTKDDGGGGVYVKAGTFNMYGGTISENTASEKGGGVYLDKGTFTMTGGKISDNKAAYDNGGGVYVYYDGTFTMEGGTIAGNTAINGGGVLNYGTFTMNGGTIEKNYDVLFGGGVFNYGTFTMKDGTISGNTADYNGGGVHNTVNFTMTGGTIEGNNAKLGGGVYNAGNFTMTEGTIKDNTAKEKGNGVYSYFSFVKEGGEIDGSIESEEGTLCTVTFNANDESNKTIIQYVRSDNEINLVPNKFTYDHKRFEGWNTERYGGGKPYKDNEKINISNNLILYAQWKDVDIISYDVNFVVNNGSWDDGTKEKKVTYRMYEDEDKALILEDKDIPSHGNPDTGYKAEGWETDPDTEHKITSNITYTYNFVPIKYTIEYDANGGEGNMSDQNRKYDDKEPLTANAFTNKGRTFNGWNTEADGSGTSYADKEANNLSSKDGETVNLYAQWTIDTFTISWKDYDGTVLETDTDVAYGTTPTFDGETPKRDNSGNIKYTFNGWTPEIDTVKGATTYTATYSEEEIAEPEEPKAPEEPTDPEIPERDWLDDLRLQLRIANELGGPRTVIYSGDFALSYDIMLYLVEHPDITLIYTVTYEGVEYTITIPGGKAIADHNIPWYGPLWLLANYGDKVPEIMAGSGRYTVVEGDTLSGIAAKFNTTVEELAKKNGIKDPNYIIVGQVIVY